MAGIHALTRRRGVRTGFLGSAAVAVALVLCSCESADKREGGSARWDPDTAGTIQASKNAGTGPGHAYGSHPFDPISMRIHPLTHVQKASDISGSSGSGSETPSPGHSESRINCFIEFKDRWGDTCKALGSLQVQLYRPATEPGQERQDATWDADLTDLAKNADWFDPITRAYRLQLQVPIWLGDPGQNGQIKLRVVFTPASADGDGKRLRDEFVVTRS